MHGEILDARGRNSGLYTAMGGSLELNREIGGLPKNSAVMEKYTCHRRRSGWAIRIISRPKTCDPHELKHANTSGRDAHEGHE